MGQVLPWFLPTIVAPLGLLIPVAPRSGPLFILLIGIAGITHYIRKRPSLEWLKCKPMAALLAFLIYITLSSLWSENPGRSFGQALRMTLLAFFALCGFSLIRALDENQKNKVYTCLIPALVVGIVTGSVYGLLQYTGPYIRVLTDFIGGSSGFSDFMAGDTRLHIAKTMLLTNLAFFTVLPFLYKTNKSLAVASYLALLAVCFYSDSQSSLITSLAGGIIFVTIHTRGKLAFKIFPAAILASFILVIPITQSTKLMQLAEGFRDVSVFKGASVTHRSDIYQLFSQLIIDNTLIGHGIMSGVKFESANSSINLNVVPVSIRTPHNIHLQVLFDTGVLGAVLFLLCLLFPIWWLIRRYQDDLAAAVLLLVCVFIVSTMFNFVVWRTWIPSAFVLSFFFSFLGINSQKTQLSNFR